MTVVADVMRRDFVAVAPEDTLGEVAQKMVDVNRGSVVVTDFGRLIGILTERDMLKAMAGRVHTSDARVREWMTPEPITAPADTDAAEAAKTMLDNGFRHLPVVDGDTVLGVVSLRQLVAARDVGPPCPGSTSHARNCRLVFSVGNSYRRWRSDPSSRRSSMFNELTEELLDLSATEKGYRGALYAVAEEGGGCSGLTICSSIILCCYLCTHICWSPDA